MADHLSGEPKDRCQGRLVGTVMKDKREHNIRESAEADDSDGEVYNDTVSLKGKDDKSCEE